MAAKRTAASPVEAMLRRHRLRRSAPPWLLAIAGYFLFPDYLPLGTQILVMILFALSLDLILGYAGIVTLGHAAFFGLGAYTAGILAARGWRRAAQRPWRRRRRRRPRSAATGAIILRTTA